MKRPRWEYTKGENHVGVATVHMHGQQIEKDVFVEGWRGALYGKIKGSYFNATVYADGRWGDDYTWTDLILFDPWQRVADRRVMRVIHLVEATKQRLGVT